MEARIHETAIETRKYYDIWRHNYWSEIQFEPRALSIDFAHKYSRDIFFRERERERELRNV